MVAGDGTSAWPGAANTGTLPPNTKGKLGPSPALGGETATVTTVAKQYLFRKSARWLNKSYKTNIFQVSRRANQDDNDYDERLENQTV